MKLQRIWMTALLAFLTTLAIGDTRFVVNFKSPNRGVVALAQTPEARKAEADRLLQQGIQQFRSRQFEATIQSFQGAIAIYREIKDREGEIKALQALSYAYESGQNFPKAIETYEQILAISRTIPNRRSEGLTLGSLGNVYFAMGDFPKAIEYLQQSLTIAREIKDPQIESLTLGNLGNAYFSMADFSKAIEYQEQLLAIARQIKDPKSEVKALANLGIAYYYLANYPKAIEYEEQWLKIEQELKNRQGEAAALANIGLAYLSMGDFQKAIDYQQQTLTIAREIKDRQSEGKALGNLGLAYDSLGDYENAIDYAQQWLAIAKEIKDRQSEGKALGNLGKVYLSLGDYAKAIDYAQQWLTIAKEIKDIQSEASALGNLGNAYFFLGDFPKSNQYLEQTLKIARQIKDRQTEGKTLGNLGINYISIKDYPKAIEYLEQWLAISKEIKDRPNEGKALGSLGLVYFSQEDYPKAKENLQQWLVIAREIKDRQSEGKALGSLGIVYGALEDYPKAIEYFQQHLVIAREMKDRQSETIALRNLGIALFKSRNLPESEKTLLESIDVLESLRGGLKDSDKVSIFDTQADTYITLQRVLIQQNKSDAALEVAERGRARAFVELLAKRLSTNPKKPAPETIVKPTISEIKRIAKEQNTTVIQYSIINDEVNIGGKGQKKELDLYIWVVKPTGEVTFRKSYLEPLWTQQQQVQDGETRGVAPASLAEIVSRSRESIFLAEETQTENLQQLYQVLIQPIADLLPTNPNDRVTFIPQGALFLIPFPALQDEQGKYLIEKHTILTSPAIQLLDLTRKQRQLVTGKDILVVGNPTMPSIASKFGDPPEQLDSLPGAETEAKTIAQLLNTKALIGNEATKVAIVQQLPNARIIHLATHGLLEDFTGLGVPGAIALAPSNNDNGLLTSSEILDLKLHAELVVLSACNTGKGKITGDGVIGLSRSIISAGVPTVIVSLWAVPDAPTASLMTEFYQNLQKSPDKAQALRQAMLKVMKENPDPQDWAAFTAIGEAE